jgi:predicted RNase H-like HicB family nuclease
VAGAYNHDLRGIATHGGTLGTASQNAKTPARTQR